MRFPRYFRECSFFFFFFVSTGLDDVKKKKRRREMGKGGGGFVYIMGFAMRRSYLRWSR